MEDEAAAEEANAGVAASCSIRITDLRRREGYCGWWVVGRSVGALSGGQVVGQDVLLV